LGLTARPSSKPIASREQGGPSWLPGGATTDRRPASVQDSISHLIRAGGGFVRAILDGLYRISGWAAALCLVAIVIMVMMQIIGRMVDGALRLLGYPPYGFLVAGLAEIAGYLLAVSSLLAL